ncbi:MAG: toll/interleukin-1 receptor domain-containing protein [Ruminococcus flavefaciens]|nr:toll/interleukin-1 receptor domain-containing protein [Ruminococcus flavefaciens]
MEPIYFEKLMGLYDRKHTSQKDRVYIMYELTKYYSNDIVRFFKRKAHSEYNFQLREMAVKYLQQFYHYTVLRKQKYMRIPTKNKKRKAKLKIYAKQRYNIESIPSELVYRIENSKEQKLKHFDFFISHSSADFDAVQALISYLNKQNKNIYCDWISDVDYLKRNLVGDATKYVIEKRLQQSNNMIFVDSENSRKSDWVKYEMNYFKNLNKAIYYLSITDIKSNNFKYKRLSNEWFYDENFADLKLY